MILGRFEPLTVFSIFQPRWHDKKVLLKASKVKDAKTKYLKVVYTNAPTLDGDWAISKAKAMTFPKETNGVIPCYAIPLKEMEILEINQRDLRGVI